MKHCVIIGSGLGGLACGAILSRNGYRVTVLEQHFQAGGCLQCFKRGEAKFETGMHFIGSAAKGQILDRLLHFLDIADSLTLSPLAANGYEVVSFGGKRYRYATGAEAFVETLAAEFPHERDNLARYWQLVERVAAASSLNSLSHVDSDEALKTEYQLRAVDTVLDEMIGDEMLRRVLAGNIPLYAAERGKTPFATHAFIMDFYNRSAWRVVGGSDRIAQALCNRIAAAGGSVQTRRRVTKIVTDDVTGAACGVLTADGEHFDADVVIADIHPARLVELTDTPLLRPAYRRRVAQLPETVGCFTLYLDFLPDEVPYINANFYGYAGDTPWGCERLSANDPAWPGGYLYMHLCSEPQQQFARTGVIISYMKWDDVAQWQNTQIGRRGPDYEAFKKACADRLFALVEREFPSLRSHVRAYYTSTPLTYRDYTGTERGSLYGIARDVALGPAGRVQHRTRVPGLLLTGQNINSHGILGVLVGAMVTCADLVGAQTLAQQLNEA